MKAIAPFLLLLICSCSNQQIYDNARLNNERECYQRPDSQVEECLQANSQSYEEYQRERDALKQQ